MTVDQRSTIAEPQRIFRLELTDHTFLEFSDDSSGFGHLRENDIAGILDDGTYREIPLTDVFRISTKSPSVAATVGNIAFIGVTVAMIVYAVENSSPLGGSPIIR